MNTRLRTGIDRYCAEFSTEPEIFEIVLDVIPDELLLSRIERALIEHEPIHDDDELLYSAFYPDYSPLN